MPAERVPMRSVREILRLKAEGLSDRAIARSTRLARSTVNDYAGRAVAARLSWPLPEGLTDTALEGLLFVRGGPAAGVRRKPEPDWASLHRELPLEYRLRRLDGHFGRAQDVQNLLSFLLLHHGAQADSRRGLSGHHHLQTGVADLDHVAGRLPAAELALFDLLDFADTMRRMDRHLSGLE